jgi:hypothetical protein
MREAFETFRDFYPHYLEEHRNKTCRRQHVVGTCLVIITLLFALASQRYGTLWVLPLLGYGFTWIGHFFFEKNRPATFRFPLYSLLTDVVMFRDILVGRIRF